MGATGWFDGSTFLLPPSNNTAQLKTSSLEYPATYELQLSATLDSVTQTCPSITFSVDYLDCNHVDPLTYLSHTSALYSSNITATPPLAQTYTMGEQPLSVAFNEFKIGFCKVTGYTV